MPSSEKAQKKAAYFNKLGDLVRTYQKVLIVFADHVGSKQLSDIRVALRGKAVVLMGKNTMIRTALRQQIAEMPEIEKLLPCVRLNIGFVFCMEEPTEVRKIILQHRVPAPARQGVVAPCSVVVPPGPTGLDPSQTSFFQALSIPTKIQKGQIEILGAVDLIREGDRVTASQATLLQKLNIKPFSYGLQARQVYDAGVVYDAAVLDITDDDIYERFRRGVANIAAISRELNIPTPASIPYAFTNAIKNVRALVIEAEPEIKV